MKNEVEKVNVLKIGRFPENDGAHAISLALGSSKYMLLKTKLPMHSESPSWHPPHTEVHWGDSGDRNLHQPRKYLKTEQAHQTVLLHPVCHGG